MPSLYDINQDAVVASKFVELGITQIVPTTNAVISSSLSQSIAVNTATISRQLIENSFYRNKFSMTLAGDMTARCFTETGIGSPYDLDPVIIDWGARVVANGGDSASIKTKLGSNFCMC